MTKSTSWRIEVPQTYFAQSSAKDYSGDVGLALVREFAQNAADAGATRVTFEFLGENVLRVSDDGRGCDATVVRERLLTPLGSKKEADAVGGFGKAKELLFFANPSWRIVTQDVVVVGSYLTVESFETERPLQPGFVATVTLPPALWRTARDAARNFMRCSERGVCWVLDGTEVSTDVKRPARAVKDFGFAKAYLDKSSHDSVVYLRTGGLLTGTRWGSHARTCGRVIIEVTKPSFEVLTPSRDWFREDEHRRAVESWLHALAVDHASALAEEQGDEILFHDFEAFVPPSGFASDVLPSTAGATAPVRFTVEASVSSAPMALSAEVIEAAMAGIKGLPAGAAGIPAGAVTTARPVRKAPQGFHLGLLPHIDGLTRIAARTGSKAQAKVAAKWLAKNALVAQRVLAAWATAARILCRKANLTFDSVGFTFANDVEAQFLRSNRRVAVLINPLKFDINAPDAVEELIDRTIHEVTHYTARHHNEEFTTTEFVLRRLMRDALTRGAVARALRTGAFEQEEAL